MERHKRGEVLECFGSGTAVIVNGIDNIHYGGSDYRFPIDPKLGIGPIAYKVRKQLLDIQEGRA